MLIDVGFLALGFVGLLFGGDMLVRGAVTLAALARISPMIIGLTLVGFGTSTPELVTSVQAALAGAPGIAVGNVVGSNIANILLILGVAALLRPIAVAPDALKRDGTVLVLVSLLSLALVFAGTLGRGFGVLLVGTLAAYVFATILFERRRQSAAAAVYVHEAESVTPASAPAWRAVGLLVLGIAITILAARFLVSGAISLASGLGISETVVGLTVVAVGTSLPELVTSVIAARKGHSDVALGNVIGSNIFNILGILGVTALVRPIDIPASILALDIWVMLAATLVLIVFARTGWRVGRREAAALTLGYGAYLGVLVAQV